jgi:sugar phosphate isomerase/epimerase
MSIRRTVTAGTWKNQRHNVQKKAGVVMNKKQLMFVPIVLSLTTMAFAAELKMHPQTEVYDGWKLGVQAWSFNRFTLFEAIDKTRSLGLDYIQAYPGQKVSPDIPDGFGPDLSEQQRKAVKEKLAEAGIEAVAFGVTKIPGDEAGARKLFDFAKDMGIGTLVSEPAEDQYELIDKLCREYQIKLAIHNHPKPSHYWNPDTVLKMCEGRSKWIGACVDVGHWVRSGLDPLECLKKLKGRILDVHIKEIDDGHDVVWGTGKGRIKSILEELHAQGYAGTFAIEYEYNWDNNIPEIRESIAYFDSIASALKPTGWKALFNKDLSNAELKEASWVMEDGQLVRKGKGDIWTKDKYADFILDLEFKLAEKTNSGVFLRAAEHTWLPWVEVQVADSFGKPIDKHICGSIYDVKEPRVNAVRKPGQWNRMTICARGSEIKAVLNNQPILDINLNDWTEAHENPDGTANKFDIAYKDLPREGWIGLQDHGFNVWYRNIKIQPLK